MKKLVILSDVHANLAALEAVRSDIARRGLAGAPICFLGDAVNMGAYPGETVKVLREMNILHRVKGNHDRYASELQRRAYLEKYFLGPDGADHAEWTIRRLDGEDKAWLGSAPAEISFTLGDAEFACFHASRGDDESAFRSDSHGGGANIVCGHIHAPYVKQLPDGGLAVNPGSVGSPLDGDPRASYAVLTCSPVPSAAIFRVDYDVDSVIADLARVPWGAAIGRVLRKASLF
ncbi:MAG: metallophosphoesterase family protein [Elusimicrobiales bacterium]|nr:metallophosphoesterase family protein [Elusimicrobiales bacterium]